MFTNKKEQNNFVSPFSGANFSTSKLLFYLLTLLQLYGIDYLLEHFYLFQVKQDIVLGLS